MPFYADLHIHSRYSRACSRDCDLEHLTWWAGHKGIAIVGTGDFTHPAWTAELRDNLVPAESTRPSEYGLFRLKPDLERAVLEKLPATCKNQPARFLLSSEISTIYKRDGRTRKVHHLLYAPSMEAAGAITKALAKIGNVASDGRPILGLDSRDLLEITLEAGGYLIPAHAWTPWFAVLGSQSGFDRVSDCYADLAEHIFAIETGLSSDPEMNRRVSSLDGYRLVSNSDAHSPPMLGREATQFDTDLSYAAIEHALRTGDGFGGTVEFYPEEGKYHLDGHRACGVRTTPEETRAAGGKCPVCGKQPTVGVQHRVDVLADRPEGYQLTGAAGFRSFVPLPEIIGEIAGVGPKSKSVTAQVAALVERLGPELSILGDVPLDELAAKAPSTVVEAITRLRRGDVRRDAGYDGVYGTIRLFDPGELSAKGALFSWGDTHQSPQAPLASGVPSVESGPGVTSGGSGGGSSRPAVSPAEAHANPLHPELDPDQGAVVASERGALLVVAGPGAGKTRVLVDMIGHRISVLGVPPQRCLAVTFTRRAAAELRERLDARIGAAAARVTVTTFHGLGLIIVREQAGRLGLGAAPRVADEETRLAVLRQALGGDIARADVQRLYPSASRAQPAVGTSPDDDRTRQRYTAALRERGLVDLDELITAPVTLLSEDAALADAYRERWTDVFVDEYQDVDGLQYELLRLLTADGPGSDDSSVTAIGDPDQAIYGFRGGDVGYFLRFRADYGGARGPAREARLERSYRSAPSIVTAAMQLIRPGTLVPGRRLVPARLDIPDGPVVLRRCADERDEAELVAATIEKMLGGTSFHALDSGAVDGRVQAEHQLSFADFAVLARTSAQAAPVVEALGRRGFPVQQRSHAKLADMPGVPAIIAALGGTPYGHVLDPAEGRDPGKLSVAQRLRLAIATAISREEEQSTPHGVSHPSAPRHTQSPSLPGGHAGTPGEGVRHAEATIRSAGEALLTLAVQCGDDLARFLDQLAMGAEVDTWDPRADRVSMLTLHASKGLEFPVVFIVGCDDGLLPLRPWAGAEIDYAEERRLLFVGMTRATTRLVLTGAGRRMVRGELTESSPSPFLASVDRALLDMSGDAPRRKRKPAAQQLTLL
jgi:DNA helicase-2/ATP-dependent DNA helicase PcrA